MNRIELIKNQLAAKQKGIIFKSNKNPLNKWKKKSKIDKELLENIYYPFHNDIRDAVYKIMSNNPEFQHFYMTDMPIDKIRELTVKQIKVLVREINKVVSFKEMREDTKKFFVFLEAVNSFDQGLAVKFGVHIILYYNCLKNLSTTNHQSYLERCVSFEDLGCFALTEFGHGTNVRDIKTIATYDEVHKEFVLHSPNHEAYKWWIGGAGKTANMSCVFAQLYVRGVSYGVHAFLVPIRNKKNNLAFPGVIVGDCGPKIGNENIDNGFIGFINYRIPREALLDRYSQVSEEGIFSSTITNPDVRFATCLGALEEGRISIASGSQLLLRNSLCVAGRYAALRKQFGREENEEYSILNYPTTQIRLIPALAEHFAYQMAGFDLVSRWLEVMPLLSNPKDEKLVELHAILSVFKPISTNVVQQRIQGLREIMGGHGYSRLNMIGLWRNNNDVNLTWEGDNTVLNQQTSRFITSALQKKMKGKEVKYKTLSFLSNFETVLEEKVNIQDETMLRNVDTLRQMLEHRTNLLLQKCAGRLAERIGNNQGVFDAWNDTQVFYLQSLSRSYGELYVFNCFKTRLEQVVDGPTKSVLLDLLFLFSLTSIERDLALFRENDYILSEVCDLVRNEILRLCQTLKDELIPVLDVISPPDFILGAPLGSASGFIFENYLNQVFNSKGCFERADWWQIIHENK